MADFLLQRSLHFTITTIYTVFIIATSAYILYKTKEAYKLTGHKGILYFRATFFFLALMFLTRLAARAMFEITKNTPLIPLPHIYILATLTLTGTLCIISLLYSLLWHIFEPEHNRWYIPIGLLTGAGVLSFITFKTQTLNLFLGIIVAIFITSFIIKWITTKKAKWFMKTGITYAAFFLFWLVNIYSTIVNNQRMIYTLPMFLLSIILMLFIAYKVNKHFKTKTSTKSKVIDA